jgi:hypothetical protein
MLIVLPVIHLSTLLVKKSNLNAKEQADFDGPRQNPLVPVHSLSSFYFPRFDISNRKTKLYIVMGNPMA